MMDQETKMVQAVLVVEMVDKLKSQKIQSLKKLLNVISLHLTVMVLVIMPVTLVKQCQIYISMLTQMIIHWFK